jgi:uncharacterized protein
MAGLSHSRSEGVVSVAEAHGGRRQETRVTLCGRTVTTLAENQDDREVALKIVEDCSYATLASVNPDGTPYCIPISPVIVGEHVYFHGTRTGQKVDNILRDPHVCIAAVGQCDVRPDAYTIDYTSTVITGTVTIVNDDAEKIEVLRRICLKLAAGNMGMFDEAIANSLDATGIYKMEIDTISHRQNAAPSR